MTNTSQRRVRVPTLAAILGLALTGLGSSAGAQQPSTNGSSATTRTVHPIRQLRPTMLRPLRKLS
jgi:hypothetical protein